MCELWSCIVSKTGQVYYLDNSNSHDAIANNFNLPDREYDPDKIAWARVEITPPLNAEHSHADRFADPALWNFNIDDDITPSWWNDGYKELAYTALREYCAKHFVTVKNGETFDSPEDIDYTMAIRCYDGQVYAHKNDKVEAYDGADITAYGSEVQAYAGAYVSAKDGATVTAWNNSFIRARDGSTVYAKDDAKVIAGRGSEVHAQGKSIVRARGESQVSVHDEATVLAEPYSRVRACDESHVYAERQAFVEADSSVHFERIEAGAICLIDDQMYIIGKNPADKKEVTTYTARRLDKYNASKKFVKPDLD